MDPSPGPRGPRGPRAAACRTAVVFDLGGVLIDWDPRHLYRKVFADDEAAMETFLATVCTPEWNARQDAGRPWAEAVASLVREFPTERDHIVAFHERWPETLGGAIEGTVAILGELRARGWPLYALSNWSAETFPIARARYPFLDLFDGIVVSGEERVVKPDARLFRVLFERYGLDPGSTVFIDDLEPNIAVAAELGMRTLRFTGPAALRADLQALGLLDTPAAPPTEGGHRTMPSIDFDRFEVLTFDCYGTLIDWEAGILAGLRGVLGPRGVTADDEELLGRYARHEAAIEAGAYLRYREVLAGALRGVCAELGVAPTEEEAATFGGSVGEWPAFVDSSAALARLAGRFRLAVITNCDDDLFAASNRRLGVTFDWVITAQQVGSYKPAVRNFEVAFERIGVPRERILHVAQSLFHDHVPAQRLGLTTAWIDRRHDRPGSGATPPAAATPDLSVPDMATLARIATIG